MKKIPLVFYIKGALLFSVYLFLSVYFLVLSPHTVPLKESLTPVNFSSDSLFCMIPRNPNESYLSGNYKGVEMRSISLGKKQCLNLLGSNEFFLQVRKRPDQYKLLIAKNEHSLFSKRYRIYQVEANEKIVLSYEESARKLQSELNLFFYLSLGFFAFITFILLRTLYIKLREQNRFKN